MSQPTISSKLARVLRTLKYPIVLAVIAGVVWYIRSQPIPVASHTVSTGSVIRSVMGTGTLEARIRTTISPKIQGRIAEVLVDQGSVVKAGQLLVRLDDEDLAQQVRMASAGIGSSAQTDVRAFRRKHIGFVFQKSNLIDFLNARENVQIAMELNGLSHRAAGTLAQELLDSLGVGDRANHEVSMLSGGQQQRVAVARALANHPSALLADEPTAALDSHRGRQVMELFRDVARQHGAGVIVVTHDHRTLDVFDTIYEMEDGVIRVSEPQSNR